MTKEEIEKERKHLIEWREQRKRYEILLRKNKQIYEDIDYKAAEQSFFNGEIDPAEWEDMKAEYDSMKGWLRNLPKIIDTFKEEEQYSKNKIAEMEKQFKREHPFNYFFYRIFRK